MGKDLESMARVWTPGEDGGQSRVPGGSQCRGSMINGEVAEEKKVRRAGERQGARDQGQ